MTSGRYVYLPEMPNDEFPAERLEALRKQQDQEDREDSRRMRNLLVKAVALDIAGFLWWLVKAAAALALCMIWPALWLAVLAYLAFKIERRLARARLNALAEVAEMEKRT